MKGCHLIYDALDPIVVKLEGIKYIVRYGDFNLDQPAKFRQWQVI
jgi:hypothetical protein